ncbi:MAG: acetyl-CoA C-acyltransferase [Planctomycetaceae bacterium]
MNEAWLLAGARTPIGKFLGAFRATPAVELGAAAIRESVARAHVEPADVDEVIMGNVVSAGIGQAPARQAALKAGLPATVSAVTVNKVCGSGLKAVMLAAQAIRLGDARIIVAGGMENMTLAPHFLRGSRQGFKLGDATLQDAMIHDGLWCAFEDRHMGLHAEYTARKATLTRDDLDRFAAESQTRAAKAMSTGAFDEEIVPVAVKEKGGSVLVKADEGPRSETNLESLAKLKPAFAEDGCVTAGNSSTLSDGAAAVVVADHATADRVRTPLRARILAAHTAGTEPRDLFFAPIAAMRGVLEKCGLGVKDIDLFEINEAFASQMLACTRELNLDASKVNVHGGAIALGHPIGASGARILVTLLYALKKYRLKRGLVSLCLGGGNAVAMVVERDA